MAEFQFRDYAPFTDGDIQVILDECRPAKPPHDALPVYAFQIVIRATGLIVGGVRVRVGYTDDTVRYFGHIGYNVEAPYRGHGYAARACELIKPVIVDHGLDVIWITCNPDNVASRKTCERIGCDFIEIVDVPRENPMFQRGEHQKCRYRWVVYGGG